MKIGYLMNSYPMTSTTFIRDEMAALESMNIEIKRYAIRRWNQQLVDPGTSQRAPARNICCPETLGDWS